jgi:hypothetical protein
MQAHSKWIPFMQGMLPEAKDTLYDKQVTGEVERHIDPSIANQL